MKKIMILALSAIVALSGCKKEEEEIVNNGISGKVTAVSTQKNTSTPGSIIYTNTLTVEKALEKSNGTSQKSSESKTQTQKIVYSTNLTTLKAGDGNLGKPTPTITEQETNELKTKNYTWTFSGGLTTTIKLESGRVYVSEGEHKAEVAGVPNFTSAELVSNTVTALSKDTVSEGMIYSQHENKLLFKVTNSDNSGENIELKVIALVSKEALRDVSIEGKDFLLEGRKSSFMLVKVNNAGQKIEAGRREVTYQNSVTFSDYSSYVAVVNDFNIAPAGSYGSKIASGTRTEGNNISLNKFRKEYLVSLGTTPNYGLSFFGGTEEGVYKEAGLSGEVNFKSEDYTFTVKSHSLTDLPNVTTPDGIFAVKKVNITIVAAYGGISTEYTNSMELRKLISAANPYDIAITGTMDKCGASVAWDKDGNLADAFVVLYNPDGTGAEGGYSLYINGVFQKFYNWNEATPPFASNVRVSVWQKGDGVWIPANVRTFSEYYNYTSFLKAGGSLGSRGIQDIADETGNSNVFYPTIGAENPDGTVTFSYTNYLGQAKTLTVGAHP